MLFLQYFSGSERLSKISLREAKLITQSNFLFKYSSHDSNELCQLFSAVATRERLSIQLLHKYCTFISVSCVTHLTFVSHYFIYFVMLLPILVNKVVYKTVLNYCLTSAVLFIPPVQTGTAGTTGTPVQTGTDRYDRYGLLQPGQPAGQRANSQQA